MSIAENIARIRDRIARAAHRAGRDPSAIELMAVTKTVGTAQIEEAFEAGIRLFGENRVQEFAAKADTLRRLAGAKWHMIGHLQSNKSRSAVELFDQVDSVDSVRLAQRLSGAALELGKRLPVLIEINIGGEQAKSGFAPDSAELEQLLRLAPELHIEIRGLMTVPPYSEMAEDSRPYFRKMRILLEEWRRQQLLTGPISVLSIGMSHDFEVAIEEGSTCVRIGTAIFGERVVSA